MNKKYILPILLFKSIFSTQIYIENWSTSPVFISKLTIPEAKNSSITAQVSIQPGQSFPLHINDAGQIFNNFNEITVAFNVDGYTKQETIFFPNEATHETSLEFTDSGYQRSPFNILKK